MTENISILGSTGSIGTQTLDVVRKLNLKVSALTAASNTKLMEQQIREFKPKLAVMFNQQAAKDLKEKIADTSTKVSYGMDGLIEAAVIDSADTVLNSVVGMVGLQPTLSAINAKKNIALANKETLVTGGKLVMEAVKRNNVNMYPVDSEHSAIFQCLQGMNNKKELKKIILTASGGPFFGKTKSELENVTLEQALNHPNWSMGKKITIDSATMMNKGLEVIEAKWLFDVDYDDIEVLIHPESVVHSMIECTDTAVIGQLGTPDMRLPIQYALTYPHRIPLINSKRLSLSDIGSLHFYKPDTERFKALPLAYRAGRIVGSMPCVFNGANEEAHQLFRDGKIKFFEIVDLIEEAMNAHTVVENPSLDELIKIDKDARAFVRKRVGL